MPLNHGRQQNLADPRARSHRGEAKRIVLPYVVFSVLWITLSDVLLNTLVSSQRIRLEVSIYKGWFFVLVSAGLLVWLLRVERRKREGIARERAEDERRYREIFDSVGEAIFIHDPDGNILEVNRTALSMFGYETPADLLATSIATISAQQSDFSQIQAEARVSAALNQGPQSFPWLSRKKDGSLFRSEVALRKTIVNGHVRVLAVVRDTDAHMHMEEQLRASQERYQILFRESHDFVAITDFKGGILIDANDEFVAQFGGRDQVIGRSVLDLGIWNPPTGRTHFLAALHAARGRLKSHAARLRLGNAGLRDVLMSASIMSLDGQDCIFTSAHDVTVSRRIGDALRDSEQRYRMIADNTDDVIWLYDLALDRFTYVSSSVERLRGYTPTEVLQHSMSDALAPSSLEAVRATLPARIAAFRARDFAATTQLVEVDQLRKDGSTVPTEVVTRLISHAPDGGIQILGVSRNITERRKTQAELIRNKTWLERAERIGRLGGWSVDLSTGGVWASPEALRIYGLGDAFSRLTDIQKIVVAEHRPLLDSKWTGLLERGEPYDVEFRIRRPSDGSLVDIHSVAEYDSASRAVFGIIRDVTDEKRTEARVHQQAALLDIANDAIYVRTLDHRITFWNKGAERLYGWAAEEVVDRQTSNLFAGGDGQNEKIQSSLLAEGSWTGERTHSTKDGREVTVLARMTLIRDDAGAPQAVFAINTDISEHKRLEAKFLRAQRLESLGSLASGIAHDLNNVLAPIILSIPLLKMDASKDTIAVLDTIESSARRGAEVVKQVLTFARGVPGERTTVALSPILGETIKMASETFPKNIAISWPDRRPIWPILGDATQVHQAIMNLMVNARDAMPQGGRLTLNADNLAAQDMAAGETEETPGSFVRIRVSDTGVGIPASKVDKIFDPFFTTKPPGQGTGLGLSTVLGILRSHGGFVRVHSKEGLGTTMALYFPATPAANAPGRTEFAEPLPKGRGEQILLVDDETAVREMLRRVLERHGYRVLAASDGAEAVGIFIQNRTQIAAVISDMMMPGMDGPSFVRIVREFDPTAPIVGISGIGDRAALSAVESAGLSAFLVKPFSNERLLVALAAALATRPAPAQN